MVLQKTCYLHKSLFLGFEAQNLKSGFHHLWLPYVVFLLIKWVWKTSSLLAFLLYTSMFSLSLSYPIISLAYYYLVNEVGLIDKSVPFVKDGKHVTCHYTQRKKAASIGQCGGECSYCLFSWIKLGWLLNWALFI